MITVTVITIALMILAFFKLPVAHGIPFVNNESISVLRYARRLTIVRLRDTDVHDRELFREANDGRGEEGPHGHPERREDRGQHCIAFPRPLSVSPHNYNNVKASGQCPGIALKRMTMGILNPPWRTTSTSSAYLSLVSSIFLARALHIYLNALRVHIARPQENQNGPGQVMLGTAPTRGEEQSPQEAAELAEDGPRSDNPESDPHAPDIATQDRDDFVPEELPEVPERSERTTFLLSRMRLFSYSQEEKTGRT